RSAVAGVPAASGADAVCHPADRVGVPGAARPATESAVHEPGAIAGLGPESSRDLGGAISGGAGLGERGAVARETRLAVGPARRLGQVVAVASGGGCGGGLRELPGA